MSSRTRDENLSLNSTVRPSPSAINSFSSSGTMPLTVLMVFGLRLITAENKILNTRIANEQFRAFAKLILGDMRIDLRRSDKPVAEKFLNLPDVISPSDKIKPDRMTKGMRGISPIKTGKTDPLFKIMLDTARA